MHAVRVTVFCDECVRIEYAPGGRFCDHPSLFAINAPGGEWVGGVYTTSADAGSAPIVVETSRLRFQYTPDGRPPHGGNMRAAIVHPCPPADIPVESGRVVWRAGDRNRHNLGGTLSTLDGLRGARALGEGLLARDGWHVVDDSRRHLLIDGWARTRDQEGLGGNLDWYLFAYGDDYAAALAALGLVAGRVPMPRRYALGSWYSRYWPYTSDEYRGVVDEFEMHGFPLDVLVLDMDWHKDGWTGWSWNRELLPDAEELIAWLHSRGVAVTLNLHPADGVGPHEDRYAAFMRAIGREADGSRVPFDAGDRAYMRALFEEVHAPLEVGSGKAEVGSDAEGRVSAQIRVPTSHFPLPTSGIDFWWVDWQQDKYVRSIPGLTNLRWLNHLYFQHTRREASGKGDEGVRGLSFSRWAADEGGADAGTEWGVPATGGWGDHRHPIHFSGDAHTGWEMLAFQVPFTAAAGNIGCFFWSHDIGGHFGARLEEATARWVQFGALSPVLRTHSARSGALDRRPWTYEGRFCESMRRAYRMRAALMPYIYTSVRECHERMLPLLRPMYVGWANQERAYRVAGQYMLGGDVLCAPVVKAGMGERCVAGRYVWFPAERGNVGCGMSDVGCSEGRSAHPTSDIRHPTSSWYDLSTGEAHAPGTEAFVSADIDRTPVFVRGGVLLPTVPGDGARMMGGVGEKLIVQAFAGGDGERIDSGLYEDDGISLGHESGRSATTAMKAEWGRDGGAVRLHATIGPTRGEFAGQTAVREMELHVGAVHRVVSAAVDGRPVRCTVDSDGAGGTAVVRCGRVDIRRAIDVRFVYEAVDARLIAHRARLADFGAAIGRWIGTMDLRAAVAGECAKASAGEEERVAALLAIGAGIGAVREDGSVRLVDSLGWIDGAHAQAEIVDRLGLTERVVGREAVALTATGGHARAGSVAVRLPPQDSPPLGLRATRLVRFRFTVHGAPLVVGEVVLTRLKPLSAFVVVGPFDWDWRKEIGQTVYAPEGSPVDAGALLDGRGGGRVGWRQGSRGPKWEVDLRASLGERGGLAYAATTLLSPRRQKAEIHFACGDKLVAWLNGTKIITLDDHSAHGAVRPVASVVLEALKNELLVKTTDGGGGWGFAATVDADETIAQAMPGV